MSREMKRYLIYKLKHTFFDISIINIKLYDLC